MKKSFIRVLTVAAAVVFSLLLFGCGDKSAQETAANDLSQVQQGDADVEEGDFEDDPNVPKIVIDGKRLKTDYPPETKNGETMVPFRDILNAFGFEDSEITWEEKTRKIRAEHGDNVIVFYIDMTTASGGGKSFELKTPPYINEDNVTMVPVKFIAAAMSADFYYDAEKNANIITTKN